MKKSNSFVFVAVFDNENDARVAMKELKKARGAQTGPIKKAARLRCSSDGLLYFSDMYDKRPGTATALGGIIGGILGLLGETIVVPLTTGAMIGALAAKLRDSGFSEDSLNHRAKDLKSGTCLIVAEVEPGSIGEVEWLLQQAGAFVSIHEVQSEVVSSLEACHDLKLNLGISVNGSPSEETIVNS